MIEFRYSQSEFNDLLSLFQSAIECGEYTEKISYNTWRKLKKLTGPIIIEYESPFVGIKNCLIRADGTESWDIIYSAKIYDWGFGRFFYDYVVKEKYKMINSKATASLKACDAAMSATTAISAVDYTKADTVDGIDWADALTGKSAYSYDSNCNTDCTKATSTYSTCTYDTVKIAEDHIRSNTIELAPNYYQVNGTWDSIVSKSEMNERFNKLETELQKKVDKTEIEVLKNRKEKENDTMMKGINFDFGPCGNTVRLSMYGMAIQNVSGEWVSYNPDSHEIINVDVFNIADGGKYMYKMPVAIADIKKGDIVIHNRVPMFVTAINKNGTFVVTDVRAGETKNIIPTRSPFGFNFITKVVSLFGAFTDAPSADQPFGNMLPFLMMSDNKDIGPMMMFFMMNQGNTNIMTNPMMMYFMMKDNKDFDPMMLMFMMNQPQPHTCNCGKTPVNPAAQV